MLLIYAFLHLLGDTVTLPKACFFKSVKIKPNYSPLFSETVLNCNMKVVDSRTGLPGTAGIFEDVYKINFYSTFSYEFKFDTSKTYIYPMSTSFILTNIFGHRMLKAADSFQKWHSMYSEVVNKIKNS